MLVDTLAIIVSYYINKHPSFVVALSSSVIMKQQQQLQQQHFLYAALGATVATVAAIAYQYYVKENINGKRGGRKATKTSTIDDKNDPSNSIYLDYNGTTPIYADVLDAMMPYMTTYYGNPSSSHIHGKEPRRAINHARSQILKLLGITAQDSDPMLSSIWFTGCGTESDNLAIALALQSSSSSNAGKKKKHHVVTCNVEHPAIAGYLENLESQGIIDVTYVPVQNDGRVKAQDVKDAIVDDTILVTIMLANNESGAIQPIQEISQICRQRQILFHTDAAQAAGKVSLDLDLMGNPDMVSIVGHKLGAPKGIACLFVRPGCLQLKHNHGILLIGGGQEFGRRGGTENTPYIVGFGLAAEMAVQNLETNQQYMESLRGRLLQHLRTNLGDDNVHANGPSDPSLRLPNTLSVGFKNIHSGDLLSEIGHLVCASAGATCHSAGAVSCVLKAMNIPDTFARGTLRLSLGPKTKPEEIDRAAKIISDAVQRQWESNKSSTSQ